MSGHSSAPASAQLDKTAFHNSEGLGLQNRCPPTRQQKPRTVRATPCPSWGSANTSAGWHATATRDNQPRRCPSQLHAAQSPGAPSVAERARADYMAAPPAGGRDFFNWVLDLPWQRVAVWLVVVFAGLQLREFFGVSRFVMSCKAVHDSLHACA